MIGFEETERAYLELEGHPGGLQTLSDNTKIRVLKSGNPSMLPEFSVYVVSGDNDIYFGVNTLGLTNFSINEKKVTLDSLFRPNYKDNFRIVYPKGEPYGNYVEMYLETSRPLVEWLEEIKKERRFSHPPVEIQRRLDISAVNREFERFMWTINPRFNINDHCLDHR